MRCISPSGLGVLGGVCLFVTTTLAAPQRGPVSERPNPDDRGTQAAEPEAPSASPTAVPAAAIPHLVKFSGAVRDLAGRPITGPADLTFALYEDEAGGAPLWWETQTLEADAQGRYTVLLGAMHADGLPIDVFTSDQAHWLGVQVGNLPEQPRVLLVSVPYALKAADAETLGGKPASSYMLAPSAGGTREGSTNSATTTVITGPTPELAAPGRGKASPEAITSGGTANYLTGWVDSSTLGTSAIFQDPVTGNIGIGTANPQANLNLSGSGAPGLFLNSTNWPPNRFATQLGMQSGAQGILVLGNNGPNEIRFGSTSIGGYGSIYVNNTANYNSAANGMLAMYFGSNGNVGIGTTTPGAMLDVAGNINSSGSVTATSYSGNGSGLTGVGTITGVAPGSGLAGGGSSGNVTLSLLTSCSSGQLLKWSGSAWACNNDLNSGGTITAVNSGSGLTGGGTSGSVSLAMTPAARTRAITYLAGCDNCALLQSTDGQRQIYVNLVGNMTLNSVTCISDAGGPTINIARDNGGPTNLLSSNLTCSTTGASTTSFASSALNLNDQLDFVMVTPDGVAKRATVIIQATLN